MALENLFWLENSGAKGYEVKISWDDPYLAGILSDFRRKLKEKVRELGGILVEGEKESKIYFSQNSFSYYCLEELQEFVNLMEVREVELPRKILLELYSMENTRLKLCGGKLVGKLIKRIGPFLTSMEISMEVSKRAPLEDPEGEIKGSLFFSERDLVLGKAREVSKEKAFYALRGRRDPRRALGIRIKGKYYLPEDLVKVIPWRGKCRGARIPGARKVCGEKVEAEEFEVVTGSGNYEDALEAASERAKPYLLPRERIVFTYHDKRSKEFCEEVASFGIAKVEIEPDGVDVEEGYVISDSGPYKYFLGSRKRDPFRLLLQAIEDAGGWYCVSSKAFLGPLMFYYSDGKGIRKMSADVLGLPGSSEKPKAFVANWKAVKALPREQRTLRVTVRTASGVISSEKGIFKAGPYYFVCPIPGGGCYCVRSAEEAELLYRLCLLNPHFQVNKYTSIKIRPPYHLQFLKRSTRASSLPLF